MRSFNPASRTADCNRQYLVSEVPELESYSLRSGGVLCPPCDICICVDMLSRCLKAVPKLSSSAANLQNPLKREIHLSRTPCRVQQALAWSEDDQSLPMRLSFQALLLDAAGTLISPSESVAEVYARYGARHGVKRNEAEILAGFRRAFNTPWAKTTSRYVGDGRPFWQFIVRESTGCASPDLLEEVYAYFGEAKAWTVAPGAVAALQQVKSAGIKLGLVSNFDTRLRPLLAELHLTDLFDTIIISAEEGFEKPNPILFERACAHMGVEPSVTVHVGDDRRNDVTGARLAGCSAWLWGSDVDSFAMLAHLVVHGLESQSHL